MPFWLDARIPHSRYPEPGGPGDEVGRDEVDRDEVDRDDEPAERHTSTMDNGGHAPPEFSGELAALSGWTWEYLGDGADPETWMLVGYHDHDRGFDMLYLGADGRGRLFRRDAEMALLIDRDGDITTLAALANGGAARRDDS